MRKTTEEKKELLSRAVALMKQGKTQKQISEILGITEKTVGKWLKPYKEQRKQIEQIKKLLCERIKKSLLHPKPKYSEISKMFDCEIKLRNL